MKTKVRQKGVNTHEAELLDLTSALAAAISVPPSRRDADTIRALWAQIDHMRPQLNRLHRQLRRDRRGSNAETEPEDNAARRGDKSSEFNRLNKRLKLWDAMEGMVKRHIDPEPVPLIRPRPGTDMDALLTMFYRAFHIMANPHYQSPEARELGCFADIPMRIQDFDLLMSAAYRLLLAQGKTEGTRFLDVGAGGGTKVMAAAPYFTQCDGLEYDQAYTEAATQMLKTIQFETGRMLHGNALTFERYDAYDVIYFYRPMKDDALLAEIERRVMSQARPGTVVLAPYSLSLEPRPNFEGAHIVGPIFVAGMTQADADALRYEAERTDVKIVQRTRDYPFDTGFWSPLLKAASFNPPGRSARLV